MAATSQCPQGSQDPIFNIQACDVPCVFPIPQGEWIQDPRVPQSPQDIDDTLDIPFIFPDPDIPCPTLTSKSGLLVITAGECCSFEFDIDIDILCPTITGGQGETSIVSVGDEYAELIIQTPSAQDSASDSAEDCAFEFSLNIGFPCPQIGGGASATIVPVGEHGVDFSIGVGTSQQGQQVGC